MARSLSPARPLALLVALALSLTLATVPGSASSATDGSGLGPAAPPASSTVDYPLAPRTTTGKTGKHPDTPVLPAKCATVEELIPRTPMKCWLNPKIKGRVPTIALQGDSHSWQMIPAIRKAIGNRRINFVGFIFGACPPMDPALQNGAEVRAANNCEKTGNKAMRFYSNAAKRNLPLRVVIGGAWQIYHHVQTKGDLVKFQGHTITGYANVAEQARTGIPRLFKSLKRLGIPADVVGQSPFVPAHPKSCAAGMEPYRCALYRKVVIADEAHNRAQLKKWMRGLPGNPKLTKQSNYMCSAKICQGVVKGVNTYFDHGHIGARMSENLAPYFFPTVRKLVKGVR